MNTIGIVIVNWNTKDLLRNCLNSIKKETVKHTYTIYVVDNNSPDNSAAMVKEEFPEVILIANSDNKGFAPANNQALRIAKESIMMLLNPDTIVIGNAIDRMCDFYRANNYGVLTCKLLNDDLTLQKSANSFFSLWRSFFENRFFSDLGAKLNLKGSTFMTYWDHAEDREIDWSYGAVMMFSQEVIKKVGILDDQYYIYAEEMDYFLRVQKAGYRNYFLSNVNIIHYGKSSSRQRRGAMFIQNYKSFYIFLKKHYSLPTYYAYRTRTLVYLKLWLIKFSLQYLLKKLTGKNADEEKTQIRVYYDTVMWHISKDSFIRVA